MRFNFLTKMALCLGIVLTLTSCDLDDDGNNNYYPDPNVAKGIIANASPSSGDLYFYADANRINNNPLNYGSANGYYPFYTGDRVLSIQNNIGETLASAEVTLETGDYFTAFAVNTFDVIELMVYTDELEYPEAGHALVRFINLSPDAEQIDIVGVSQTFAGDLAFKEATEYISVQGGTYDLNFKDSASDEVLYSDTAEFISGRIYTVYTRGFVTPPTGSNDTFTADMMRNY